MEDNPLIRLEPAVVNPRLARVPPRAVQRPGRPGQGVPRIVSHQARAQARILVHHPRAKARILALAAPVGRHPVAWTSPHQRSTLKYAAGWSSLGILALLAALAHCALPAMVLWSRLAG